MSKHPPVLSHLAVRRAIGVLGVALPVVLGPFGLLAFGVPLQDNLSAYYHTPLRDGFVGLLCALAVLLFCYRGHDRFEDWTATAAGLFALGLALLPIDTPPAADPDALFDPFTPRSLTGLAHTLCGAGFFLTLALYSLFHFPHPKYPRAEPTQDPEPAPHPLQRNVLYRLSGIAILVSMVAMGAYLVLLPDDWQSRADRIHALFWLEWLAVWSFAVAWLIKGRLLAADLAVDLLAAAQHRLLPSRS